MYQPSSMLKELFLHFELLIHVCELLLLDVADGERVYASNFTTKPRFIHPSAVVHPNAFIGEVRYLFHFKCANLFLFLSSLALTKVCSFCSELLLGSSNDILLELGRPCQFLCDAKWEVRAKVSMLYCTPSFVLDFLLECSFVFELRDISRKVIWGIWCIKVEGGVCFPHFVHFLLCCTMLWCSLLLNINANCRLELIMLYIHIPYFSLLNVLRWWVSYIYA